MKCLKFLPVALVLMSTAVFAQVTEKVTDEELKKYAITMDSIDDMSTRLMEEITEMVKNNDQISASRYNDLYKIIDNESKLKEAEATPEEIAAVKAVLKKKDDGTAKIQETFQSLAKDYVGAATYNKVKKALAVDPELKTKYEALLASINQ